MKKPSVCTPLWRSRRLRQSATSCRGRCSICSPPFSSSLAKASGRVTTSRLSWKRNVQKKGKR
eukprot:3081110-Pyramimonas_sp.AAC.1